MEIRFGNTWRMRHIPNIITSVRLVAAIAIALSAVLGTSAQQFLPWFIAGGISDMLDGFVARRFGWCTEFGARLDSISDFAIFIAVFFLFQRVNPHSIVEAMPYLIAGAIAQALHVGYASLRFRIYPSYHTTLSRVIAYAIYFGIAGAWIFHATWLFPLVCCLWTACCIEGMIITTALREPAVNISSIAAVIRRQQAQTS